MKNIRIQKRESAAVALDPQGWWLLLMGINWACLPGESAVWARPIIRLY